jgi:tRNA pseudouridine32 synthase/23S rRNA pseudouridine746 synthase
MKIYKSVVKKYFTQKISLEEFLLKLTPLNSDQISDVAKKGGVWIQKKGIGKILRIKVIKEQISPEDIIQIFYDPKVLSLPEASDIELLYENKNYGIWIKPSGIVSQGSQASDHASLLWFVEKKKRQEVFLVHRIDRETTGLMIVAYNSKAAAVLSDLFQKNQIHKNYQAVVLGPMKIHHQEMIRASLDDKEAITKLEVLNSFNNQSLLNIIIETGRLHQIRRHLDFIGHPIMGDPKYGKGNKNKEGLKLVAYSLSFMDPWSCVNKDFQLPENYLLKLPE